MEFYDTWKISKIYKFLGTPLGKWCCIIGASSMRSFSIKTLRIESKILVNFVKFLLCGFLSLLTFATICVLEITTGGMTM